MPRNRNLITIGVCLIVLGACAGGGTWLLLVIRSATRKSLSQSQMHVVSSVLDGYAREHDETYPAGFGVLIWSGRLAPEMLCSQYAGLCPLAEHDWGYELASPRADLDAFAAEHSAYVVLVWEQPRSVSPDVLLMYERLRRGADGTPLMHADGSVQFVSNDEAVRRIRAAGHEPVWADEP